MSILSLTTPRKSLLFVTLKLRPGYVHTTFSLHLRYVFYGPVDREIATFPCTIAPY